MHCKSCIVVDSCEVATLNFMWTEMWLLEKFSTFCSREISTSYLAQAVTGYKYVALKGDTWKKKKGNTWRSLYWKFLIQIILKEFSFVRYFKNIENTTPIFLTELIYLKHDF